MLPPAHWYRLTVQAAQASDAFLFHCVRIFQKIGMRTVGVCVFILVLTLFETLLSHTCTSLVSYTSA